MKQQIILIGLPKSGTSSFQFLFEQMKLKSYHWEYQREKIGTIMNRNKQQKKPLLSGIDNWDCITQMDVCLSNNENFWPQVTDLEQLYEENPNCVFILNKRNPEKMLQSWKKWGNLDQRMYNFNPELVRPKNDEGLLLFFRNHFNTVETFFQSKPTSKFLSFDIEHDNLQKLREYIHIDETIITFPHQNKNVK